MTMFLVVMTLHVLCAALWVGIAVFGAVFLTPAARDLGPDGMKIMLALRKRGFVAFVPIIATITVLSGFWLYWRFTAGFSPEVSRSHAGMTFGTGGILGLTALIIGGAVLSRSVVQAVRLATEAAGMPEGQERADRFARAAALRQRAASAGNVVAALVVTAMILMVIARYL
jgi:uncharacterized membrane protein